VDVGVIEESDEFFIGILVLQFFHKEMGINTATDVD